MDELVWGAIWLYKATNDYYYLEQAEVLFEEANFYSPRVFSWDDKRAGVLVRLFFNTIKISNTHLQKKKHLIIFLLKIKS